MSNKYSWSIVDGGTIHSSTNNEDEYLLGHEIAVRMNKMQDIVNAAITLHSIGEQASGSLASKEATIWGDIVDAKVVFESAVQALNPKTIDQLRKERDDAATHMSSAIANYFDTMSPQAKSALEGAKECHKQAKAAHKKAVSEQS